MVTTKVYLVGKIKGSYFEPLKVFKNWDDAINFRDTTNYHNIRTPNFTDRYEIAVVDGEGF